ncbi:hypothetical protein [Actinoallomurus rhizosphaericola]|uniref:hypothetical protein n=1 Tax=Actinoallomurus rhizosphaericola TaxID=2952536 RepID=UPI002092270A|nr:hypothetical protein [Actinoallomurus rhizosphaericola]MCO5999391.1 hypothetical protein [Actinoallomurus rhizosphaericola]
MARTTALHPCWAANLASPSVSPFAQEVSGAMPSRSHWAILGSCWSVVLFSLLAIRAGNSWSAGSSRHITGP